MALTGPEPDALERLARRVEALELMLAELLGQRKGPSASGGGQLGHGITGWPHATGDVRLTANVPDEGWLPLDGRIISVSAYPELAVLIGQSHIMRPEDLHSGVRLPDWADLGFSRPTGPWKWVVKT